MINKRSKRHFANKYKYTVSNTDRPHLWRLQTRWHLSRTADTGRERLLDPCQPLYEIICVQLHANGREDKALFTSWKHDIVCIVLMTVTCLSVPGCSGQDPIYFWGRRDNNRQTLFSSIVSGISIDLRSTIAVTITHALYEGRSRVFACLLILMKTEIQKNWIKKDKYRVSCSKSIENLAHCMHFKLNSVLAWNFWNSGQYSQKNAPRWIRCASTIPRDLHQPCQKLSIFFRTLALAPDI